MYMKAMELAERTAGSSPASSRPSQRRHPREHHRAGDRRRLRGREARLLRHRLRHRRHGHRRRPGAAQARPDTKIVLSEPANAQLVGIGHAAEAHRGRRPGREPPRLRAAPDPGLDPGLHPAGAAGGDRRRLLRRADPGRRARGHDWARASSRRKEGIFTGVSGGSTFAVAMQVAEKAAPGSVILAHAARHRRALPLDAALRALRRRDERGRGRDHALHARLPASAEGGACAAAT